MKTILDIVIAVSECDPSLTDEELRLCVASQSAIQHFYRQALIDLIQLIREGQSESLLKMKAELAWGTVDRMFSAQKKQPREWLGPNNIPGSPEQRRRLEWSKRLYKKVTGESLEPEGQKG